MQREGYIIAQHLASTVKLPQSAFRTAMQEDKIKQKRKETSAISSGAGREKAVREILSAVVSLERTTDFPPIMTDVHFRIEDAGFPLSSLSVYLIDPNTSRATHYFLLPAPVGWERMSLAEANIQLKSFTEGRSLSLADGEGKAGQGLAIPVSRGTVSMSGFPSGDISADDQRFLEQVAFALEALVVRHRDLHALEKLKTKVLQADVDLMALHDGSYDLSGTSPDEVAQKTIRMIKDRLGFDRVGIFLRGNGEEVLRGAWGVDDGGNIVPILHTEFPLYPENPEDVSEAALIARGERAFFLTQDLDGEGGTSVEGNIEANLAVPMCVGRRIIGVLAVDNYFERRPIGEEQIQPLMILANQAAAALENAFLYATLHQAHDELEARVEERTFELARTNAVLRKEVGQRQQAEEQLRVSLEEQEMLVKEIHHRVKNNLSVISSMLSLQAMELKDEQTRQAFQDSQSRVYSVALIHEKLYLSSEIGSIQLADYIPDLAREIFDSNRTDESRVELKIDVEELDLGVDAAINSGLVVNELVMNALKHAFPADQEGEIGVEMHRVEDGMLRLAVWNTGLSLPEDLDLRQKKSLGLRLVDSLVRMLKGELQVRSGERTEFAVTFPYEEPTPS